jgi:(p)ppGpp synthase/HD superfamily hydrolase
VAYTEKFEDALRYAARVHRDQTRKGTGVPYVAYLLAVAAIVGENDGTEDEVITALLYDAPEDAGGEAQLAEIRARSGDGVADIVAGSTDTYEDPKPPWRARKEAYLGHLAEAPSPVRLVSAADKLHNARSVLSDYRTVGEDLWGRFNGGRDGTLWYYRAVADALAGDGPVADELDRVVAELERAAVGRG